MTDGLKIRCVSNFIYFIDSFIYFFFQNYSMFVFIGLDFRYLNNRNNILYVENNRNNIVYVEIQKVRK